jgi:hypothetical protein
VFDERLILICTFYRGKTGAAFDEKRAKFILKGGPLGSCDHGRHFHNSTIIHLKWQRQVKAAFIVQVEALTFRKRRSISASTPNLTR